MDVKGENVFRPRATYLLLESITRERITRGLLPDSFPEQMRRARAAVVCEYFNDGYPPRTRDFIEQHYVRCGALDVAGQRLPPGAAGSPAPRTFDVEVPQLYAIVTASGPAAGLLDGSPCAIPRELPAGEHRYEPAAGEGEVWCVWAPALARGLQLGSRGNWAIRR
jgi:hypothetical protein